MIPDKKKQLRGDVLIIDDDASICEILKGYCENMGCFRNILIAQDAQSKICINPARFEDAQKRWIRSFERNG
jgi:DNA-binding NtrC family response regulator